MADCPGQPNNPAQHTSIDDIGGLKKQLAIIRDMVELPLARPTLFAHFGMKPPKGVLLYGPPGTGKTMLLRALACQTKAHVVTINGPSIVGKYLGETEAALRDIFAEAMEKEPTIIFIDEIDALAPRRDSDETADGGRTVSMLLTLMDGMQAGGRVVVVAATNRPNAIDPALRRAGRFDREVEVGIPDAIARKAILQVHLKRMPHSLSEHDIQNLADRTHGFVGADIMSLCQEAGLRAINDGLDTALQEEDMVMNLSHIETAFTVVRPSAMREIFLESPKVYWSDIGGNETVKQRLKECVEWPLTNAEAFTRLGVVPPKGILLYGPSGCSKTLTAKALATEAGLNFLAVKGPELFNKYVGESERALREVFRKARAASPSILFFDEIDALVQSSNDNGVASSILASLLNELDGIEALNNVVVLAATNRPEVIDSALLRNGRFDRLIYVPLPDASTRREIIKIYLRKSACAELDIDELVEKTEGCSGAEIAALFQSAGLIAMEEDINIEKIQKRHVHEALTRISRRTQQDMLELYEEFTSRMSFNM